MASWSNEAPNSRKPFRQPRFLEAPLQLRRQRRIQAANELAEKALAGTIEEPTSTPLDQTSPDK